MNVNLRNKRLNTYCMWLTAICVICGECKTILLENVDSGASMLLQHSLRQANSLLSLSHNETNMDEDDEEEDDALDESLMGPDVSSSSHFSILPEESAPDAKSDRKLIPALSASKSPAAQTTKFTTPSPVKFSKRAPPKPKAAFPAVSLQGASAHRLPAAEQFSSNENQGGLHSSFRLDQLKIVDSEDTDEVVVIEVDTEGKKLDEYQEARFWTIVYKAAADADHEMRNAFEDVPAPKKEAK